MNSFPDFCQMPFSVHCTYASGHMPVFTQGVFQNITHHSAPGFIPSLLAQVVEYRPERLGAVIVVRINHCKRTVHCQTAAHYRLGRSPGFHSSFRHSKS